jgi:hypothetical protein
MYLEIGRISPDGILAELAYTEGQRWNHVIGVLGAADDDFWVQIHNKVAYIKIKPGGKIHLHTDQPPHHHKTHTVLATNDGCISRAGGVDYHCALGAIYEVDASIAHESFNHGETDRIHRVETL